MKRYKTKSTIYIGKNGIGKSNELKSIYDKDRNNSLLIKFSEKNESPDSYVLDKKNKVINDFASFLENITSILKNIEENDLPKKLKDIIREKNLLSHDQAKIDEIWEKIKNDKNITFLDDIENIIVSKKQNKQYEIKKIFYEIDLSKWKQTTAKKIENHGTGKLVYFQIKFLYEFLELIPEENKGKFNLILDEPELFLHNSLKRQVGWMLKNINDKINVFIATHSSELLNAFYKYEFTEIKSKNNYDKNTNWEIIKTNTFNIITRKEQFDLLMSDSIIVCEGNNDIKIIQYIIDHYLEDKYEKNVSILSRTPGKSKIPNIIYDILAIKINKEKEYIKKNKIFILYDEDENKNEEHKKWNNDIKKIVEIKSFSFKKDIEKYFNFKKDKFNEYEFFKEKDNIKTLEKFLDESGLKEFLKF